MLKMPLAGLSYILFKPARFSSLGTVSHFYLKALGILEQWY